MSAVLEALQQPLDTATTAPGPALDEAELLARAQALAGQLAALAEAHDASGAAPAPQFALLHQADLLRLTIAREAGGHGAGLASARAVVGAIAQGDPAVALILAMHYSNHAAIARSQRAGQGEWPADLAAQLIAASLQGPALLNAAQVEPELGSPSHGGLPAARAKRVAGGWQLSGHKVYVTGGPLLAWISVLAVTDEPEPRLGSFVLPRDTAGARLVDTWNPLGMRATVSHDLVLDGAWVPEDHAVGLRPASLGLQREAHGIAWYFSLVASVYDGAARSARDWLADFLNQRRPSALGGANLASLATVQEKFGEIEVLLQCSDWLLDSHARAYDSGTAPEGLVAVAKHVAVDNALRVVQLALELAGNHGLARRNALERHLRNVLCSQIHSPANSLIRSNTGRAALQKRQAAA